jgi:hypothetical protein
MVELRQVSDALVEQQIGAIGLNGMDPCTSMMCWQL